ncbi:MAG: putative DNA-binding domain-containing protein [Planctomycetes bacterium]|nr:putative DNA-binding domain-containing protein [Planctomycetota bacterium]
MKARSAPPAAAMRSMQRWFAAVVTHRGGAAAGVRAAARSGLAAPAIAAVGPTGFRRAARVRVYADAWFVRLREVLGGDYGALRSWLGERAFGRLARAYLAARPSRHPNLNCLGAALPLFVGRALPGDAFAAALARLELAVTHAFDAAAEPELSPDALASVPPARWPRVRLGVGASVRLLRLPAAVVDYHTAWRAGEAPRGARVGQVTLCVWRQDDQVRQRELARPAGQLLRRLQRGLPLRRALDGLPTSLPIDAWFAQWRADGLFTALR